MEFIRLASGQMFLTHCQAGTTGLAIMNVGHTTIAFMIGSYIQYQAEENKSEMQLQGLL